MDQGSRMHCLLASLLKVADYNVDVVIHVLQVESKKKQLDDYKSPQKNMIHRPVNNKKV